MQCLKCGSEYERRKWTHLPLCDPCRTANAQEQRRKHHPPKSERRKAWEARWAEMLKLRRQGWTLNQIGQRYGITHQRVQQIMANLEKSNG